MAVSAGARESGAGGAAEGDASVVQKSTQNTQYDLIGTEYLKIKELPAAESEVPSILAALGEGGARGKKCLGTCDLPHLWRRFGSI